MTCPTCHGRATSVMECRHSTPAESIAAILRDVPPRDRDRIIEAARRLLEPKPRPHVRRPEHGRVGL